MEGLLVLGTQPGSAADAAGIVVNDLILQINKEPTKDMTIYEAAGLHGIALNWKCRCSVRRQMEFQIPIQTLDWICSSVAPK